MPTSSQDPPHRPGHDGFLRQMRPYFRQVAGLLVIGSLAGNNYVRVDLLDTDESR